MADKTPQPEAAITPIRKAQDTESLRSNAMEVEDAFATMYFTGNNPKGRVIEPPIAPDRLLQMVHENNALGQCITAMEVNIDGTGHVIEPKDEETEEVEDEPDIAMVNEFMDEPYPGESFITQRRRLRRDLEGTGNAYLEIIRNPKGEVIFSRVLPSQTMRMVKLGDALPVKKKMVRRGKVEEIKILMRERSFVQKIGSQLVFFREFNSSRDIDKTNGKWGNQGEKLPADIRGTEVIHMTVTKDHTTPYGLPRWWSQLPSVLGSRKAEELNLDYFSSGGIPPVLFIIQGGSLSGEVRTKLEKILSGSASDATKGAVIEVVSTSGGIDTADKVSVNVERFGSEMASDSLFEGYDQRCEQRVRSSFRLPPLFVGKAEDYSFATAFASYTIAESQVFKPERMEFDEIINVTLMPALGAEEYVFRSLSLPINDAVVQMKGVELARDYMTEEDFITAVNEVANLNLKYDAEAAQQRQDEKAAEMEALRNQTTTPGAPAEGDAPDGDPTPQPGEPAQKSDLKSPDELLKLAGDWAAINGLDGRADFDTLYIERVRERIGELNKGERDLFDLMLANRMYSASHLDYEGSAELCGCASDIMTHAG